MELKINIVEAAAELAEIEVNNHFRYSGDKAVYTEQKNGDTIYTEDAQEVFNAEYDRIFDKLVDCKVTPVPNIYNCKTIFYEEAIEHIAKKQVERYFERTYPLDSEQDIADKTWYLGELNEIVFTKEAQGIYDRSKEYYEMQLTQFEI